LATFPTVDETDGDGPDGATGGAGVDLVDDDGVKWADSGKTPDGTDDADDDANVVRIDRTGVTTSDGWRVPPPPLTDV
jgi:hypothetical protein